MDNKNQEKISRSVMQSTNSVKSFNEMYLQLAHEQRNYINYIIDLYLHARITRKKICFNRYRATLDACSYFYENCVI